MARSGKTCLPLRRPAFAMVALSFALICPAAAAGGADLIFTDGFELPCPGVPTGITPGIGSALLLRGTVVTPTVAFVGEVLVQGDTIACVAASCTGQAGADSATIVETQGLIFPGLIDARNNVLFDVFDGDDWAPTQVYTNPDQFTNDARYRALVEAKQYLGGEAGSPVDYRCEADKYGELKALLAGTTSTTSYAGSPDRTCYASLTRTIDTARNDLGADYIQATNIFPSTPSADAVCANFADDSTHAYLVNVGEGTDAAALNQFAALGTVSTINNCLYAPQTAIAFGTVLGEAEFTQMAAAGMSLSWMPRSDTALYGQTADVPLARSKGINVALGTNWSITGSHNLLDALRDADEIDNTSWGNVLSAYDLVQMVTIDAAKALHLGTEIGSIDVARKADLTVIGGTCSNPWSTLVHSRPRDVRLVIVGGVPLYGDPSLQAAAPSSPGCETIDVCGAQKFVCVAEAGGTAADKLGQTLADIVGNLTSGLADFDAMNLTQWTFSPIAPLVDCR